MATTFRGTGVWVQPDRIELSSRAVGALPVVNAVLGRLGFDELLAGYLPEPDGRCELSPARAVGVLVRNLAVGRRPLYGLGAWAARHDPVLLGLGPDRAGSLNDDRVGRALDALFLADRASLVTALGLRAIRSYGIDCSELHNDSTSITLYGAYRNATGAPLGGVGVPRPARGHSKDHRPELKQLVEILTVSADGAVPLTHRLADGNTEDSTTHIGTWDQLAAMLGRADFVYVADCKLATRDNMDHISSRGGRFLTVLPRTRREDQAGRAWIAGGAVEWKEISRRPGKRKGDPPETYWAAEAPACSAEGYRIVWIRSSVKRSIDAAARLDRIERACAAVGALNQNLSSPRCQLRTTTAVEQAATAAIADAGAGRWVRVVLTDTIEHEHRQLKRGRPGKDTVYRRIDRHRFSVAASTDAEAVAADGASDGCFPFITNHDAAPGDLLRMYKNQPHLERRHATYKGVIEAAPVMLKSDTRLDALGFCLYVALLVHALVERELRRAMAAKGIDSLPLYYEDRACKTPTAARVFELLDPLACITVYHDGEALAVIEPTLDPLQKQLLSLLKIPRTAYSQAAQLPRNSR